MHRSLPRRRTVLTGLAGLAGASLLPRPGRAQRTFGNVTITIATFPGPWIDRINAELKDSMLAAGITMQFVGGTSTDFLAKMIAARGQAPPFDVVEIADETYDDFRRADFLAKLNPANLGHLANLDRSMYDEYKVANWATQPAIVYNVDRYKALGLPPPTRYTDLTEPKLAGHVVLSDINTYNGYYQVVGMAHENGGSDKDLEPGFKAMERIKPQSYQTAAATNMQLFASGDAWAAALPAHLAIRMLDAGVNVAAVHPVIHGSKVALARGYLSVVKGSKQQDAAEYYIDQMIATKMQERLYTQAATIPVNNDSLRALVGNVRVDKAGSPFLIMDPATIANAWAPPFADINKRDWGRRWQRMVAAQ